VIRDNGQSFGYLERSIYRIAGDEILVLHVMRGSHDIAELME